MTEFLNSHADHAGSPKFLLHSLAEPFNSKVYKTGAAWEFDSNYTWIYLKKFASWCWSDKAGNFYVTIKAATNLIPFSCMLKNFFQHEDIVLPAAFLFHWGRGMSLRVQMIQDLIKTPCTTLPHQTNETSKLNPKIPQKRNGNKTGFGCSFRLVTSSDRRNRRRNILHKKWP